MSVSYDVWLSEMFGYDAFVFKVDDDLESLRRSASLLPHQATTERAFYFAKVPCTDPSTVYLLERIGFHVVDTNMTFSREPETQLQNDSSIEIVEVQPAHVDQVLHIAETSFIYSRFHLDPLIPSALANRIKREWINNYVRDIRGETLFVALNNKIVAGFLAVLAANIEGESCKVIDLIAVDREQQGKGVGRSLIQFFTGYYLNAVDKLLVGTQAANIPSSRLYESCGFRLEESKYVLHCHMKKGVPL